MPHLLTTNSKFTLSRSKAWWIFLLTCCFALASFSSAHNHNNCAMILKVCADGSSASPYFIIHVSASPYFIMSCQCIALLHHSCQRIALFHHSCQRIALFHHSCERFTFSSPFMNRFYVTHVALFQESCLWLVQLLFKQIQTGVDGSPEKTVRLPQFKAPVGRLIIPAYLS